MFGWRCWQFLRVYIVWFCKEVKSRRQVTMDRVGWWVIEERRGEKNRDKQPWWSGLEQLVLIAKGPFLVPP